MLSDVCRLCLTKDNLVWIFDKRFENSENMKDVIYITTGVEITIKDIVSQKICKKCCEVTIKMFEFRRTSLANDRHLREQSMQNLRESVKIPHTEVTIKSNVQPENIKKEPPQDSVVFKVHPTVRDLFKVYPQIKLPTVCLKSHIAPFVSLPMDQVENYFKVRKLDINEYTKLALRSGKVATKKTTAIVRKSCSKPSINNYITSNNFQIAPVVPVGGENKLKVPPIKIVQSKPHETKLISKVEDKNISRDVTKSSENLNHKSIEIKSNEIQTPEMLPQSRKRKLDELEVTPKKDTYQKPLFIESLGLTPKADKADPHPSVSTSESPAYVANMSVPLHICDICNSVQYNAKDLKRHQHKHLRCQFCKTRFRTIDSKNQHIENTCVIKQTMNNLPDVELDKIEYNLKIRRKYPEAFVDFPHLKDMILSQISDNSDNERNQTSSNQQVCNVLEQSSDGNQVPSTVDPVIIEILSDDEEPSPSVGGINKENIVDRSVLKNSISETNASSAVKDKVDDVHGRAAKSSAPTVTVIDNVVYNTVSIVKPDIRIRGNCVLDKLDPKLSDTKILKELLSNKPIQLTDEKNVQTDIPTNETIFVNRHDSTIELKQLKQQLYVYKIPVVIKFGPLSVSYNYNMESKPPKKLSLWNDLMPIDIKTNKNSVSKIPSDPNVNKNNVVLNMCPTPTPCVVSPNTSANICQQKYSTTPPTSTSTLMSYPNRTIPPQNIISPKFIRINKSSLNSANIIDRNPLLNKFLHVAPTQTTSISTTSISTTSISTTSISTTSTPTTYFTPATTSLIPATTSLIPATTPLIPATTSLVPSTTSLIPTTTSLIPATTSLVPATSLVPPTTSLVPASSLVPATSLIPATTYLTPLATQTITTPINQQLVPQSLPTISSTVLPSSTTSDTSTSSSTIPFGTIRVKNVWELT